LEAREAVRLPTAVESSRKKQCSVGDWLSKLHEYSTRTPVTGGGGLAEQVACSWHGTPTILRAQTPSRPSNSCCSLHAPNQACSRVQAATSLSGPASIERQVARSLSALAPSGAYDCISAGCRLLWGPGRACQ